MSTRGQRERQDRLARFSRVVIAPMAAFGLLAIAIAIGMWLATPGEPPAPIKVGPVPTTTPTTPSFPWGPGKPEEPQPPNPTTTPSLRGGPGECGYPHSDECSYGPSTTTTTACPTTVPPGAEPQYIPPCPITTWHCGTDMKPSGCVDPSPADIANATTACADMRADHSEVGVENATARLLSLYGRDGVTGLFRYATVAICPDMAEPVKQEWNNRMQRRGMGESDWDSMWKPGAS